MPDDYEPRIAEAPAPAGRHARRQAVGRTKNRGRRRADRQARADATARWQLLATVARIAIDVLEFVDRFHGDLGRLL